MESVSLPRAKECCSGEMNLGKGVYSSSGIEGKKWCPREKACVIFTVMRIMRCFEN